MLRRFAANAVAETQQLLNIISVDPFILLGRNDHCDIAVLATNYNGLFLGSVNNGSKALFSFGSRNGFHTSILDKIDKLSNALSSIRCTGR